MIGVSLLLAAAAAAPLQPSGNWTVAYEASMCLASRKFGPAGQVTLMLRPSPLGGNLEVTFVADASNDRHVVWDGDATLTVQPGGRAFDASYKAWRSHTLGGRAIILTTDEELLDLLTDEGSLTLSAPKEPALSVSTRHLTKLKPVIEDCKRKVAQHWGVDLSELDRMSVPAKAAAEPVRWISTNDYPADALRNGQSGASTILWTIGTDGVVSDCKVIASSGVDSLDRAGCRAIMARGHYSPALDKAGKPMISHQMRRVMWIVP
jgi:TonB family protein